MRKALMGMLAACLAATSANATLVSKTYTFSATFADGPVTSVTQTFSLVFDPVAGGQNVPVAAYSSTNPAAAFNSPSYMVNYGYDVANTNSASDPRYFIRLSGAGSAGTLAFTDFSIFFDVQADGTPADGPRSEIYRQNGGDLIFSNSTSVSVAPYTPSAAPEPGSWAMMVGGFGLIGFAMRRHRQVGVDFA